jgi:hypothetical protein
MCAVSVASPSITLRVERVDGGLLVLDGWNLASRFFSLDSSSVGVGSYDSLAGRGEPGMITASDVTAINRTMRARSPKKYWEPIMDRPLGWLRGMPENLDLIEAGDGAWAAGGGQRLVADALAGACGRGRGVSVATKLLHLKRPRLIPVLDDLVVDQLGVSLPSEPERRAEAAHKAAALVTHLRGQGRANLPALEQIRSRLTMDGTDRSLVRILDAVLWLAHPGAVLEGAERTFTVTLR